MTINKGDIFYSVNRVNYQITKWEYLMEYPRQNNKSQGWTSYHIIINRTIEHPERIYYTYLEDLLADNCKTYQEARKLQIERMEHYLTYLKNDK